MDEKIERFIRRHKRMLVASGLIGFLITPFLWPFFLAIIFSTIRLAVPIFLILLGLKLPCRGCKKMEQTTSRAQDADAEAEDGRVGNHNKKERVNGYEQREETVSKPAGSEAESVPESGKGKSKSSGSGTDAGDRGKVLEWYHSEGRDTILRLAKRMEQAGYAGMSVQNDGLCFVKEGKGYKRIGAIRNFPERQMEIVAELLKCDGLAYANVHGKYMLLFWRQRKGGNR